MWNKTFERLQRKLTFVYAFIFGALILVVVLVAYAFVWWAIVAHEKSELVRQIYHEGEEWVSSKEPPCSDAAVKEGRMLAYFVGPDGETVLINQLDTTPRGRTLWANKSAWPKELDTARVIRVHGIENHHERYRYLAAVAPVWDGNTLVGTLYMFKNIEFYYEAAYRTLFYLLCISLALFMGVCLFGYWLAGRNIKPIKNAYERQMQFTADASHEMRTPLSVMNLAVEGALEDDESQYSEFTKESLYMMKSEVKRLTRLTADLMELARSDGGMQQIAMNPVDVTTLCRDVGTRMMTLAKKKGLDVAMDIEEGLFITGDEEKINQLLVILLDNAIKYSGDTGTITVTAKKEHHDIVVAVGDEGCGIADDEKKKIFDRFYRVDKARSRGQGGLGLGLSLAWAIIKQHHATIHVADNTPRGTIMEVRFLERQA